MGRGGTGTEPKKCLRTVKHTRPIYEILTKKRPKTIAKCNKMRKFKCVGGDENRQEREEKKGRRGDRLTVAESYVNCPHVNLNHDLHLSGDDGTLLAGIIYGSVG